MTDFTAEIFNHILQNFPTIRSADIAIIQGWQKDGASVIRHIMPALKSAKERGSKPDGFQYFTPAILKLRDGSKWWKERGIFHQEHNPDCEKTASGARASTG